MYVINPVIIAVAKDIYARLNFWVKTLLELLIPVALVFFMNLTAYPMTEPPPNDFTNDTIHKNCNWGDSDIFTLILYEPSNKFTDALMSNVKCLGGFKDVKAGKIHDVDSDYGVGVIFKGTDSTNSLIPDSLDYELFPTKGYWPNANKLWWSTLELRKGYATGGLKKFLRLIHAIDESFLQMKNIQTPEISFQNMDMVSNSPRIHKLVVLTSFFFGFLFMVPAVVGRLVQAKHSGVKELVLMMGLKKWHLWAGKLFDCVLISGTSMLLMVIFLYVPLTKHSQVLREVHFCVIASYLYFALFGVFVFLCFMSCFFNNSMLAVLTTQIVWGISFVLFAVMSWYSSQITFSVWLICCLLPHFSFFAGLSILLDFDFYGKMVNPGEILATHLDYPSFYNILFMIFFTIVLYFFLGLYLEEVIPGKFGIPKPYDFFLKKSYWYPSKVKSENTNSEPENVDFESVPEGMNVGISIRNLSKEYKSLSKSSVMAVDNISIDFYSGEISALLGHNGAGKTTVFSTISGLTTATSGQILINGYDVAENTDKARESFGYCPQHDMLFEDLTPFDNLRFFAMAKGLGVCDAPTEAYKFLDKLKLADVERTLVCKLSGGQKRKLALGIALIGGSDVVLLDEPTSGVDPEMRREIWEILLSFKGTKTILLTTHSMEEADVLSDRIAIMDHGKIKCYGTPMYLKSKYGSGYTLSVVIKNIEKVQAMTQFIQTYVKTAKLISQNILTLTYQLPEEEITNFAMVFAGLNKMQDSHKIQSYSINFSTFEDVFIRLRGTESEDARIDMVGHSYKRLNCSDEVHPTKINSYLLPFLQFYGLIIKKFIYFYRNIGSYLIFSVIVLLLNITNIFIVPAVIHGTFEITKQNGLSRPGGLTYSLESYDKFAVLYSIASENELSKSFAEYLAQHGWEARRTEDLQKGLEKLFQENFYSYMRETKMAIEFDEDKVKIFFNSYAVHIMPIALNTIYNSILLANNVSGEIKTVVNLKYSAKENKKLLILLNGRNNASKSCVMNDIPDFTGIQVLFYLIGPIRETFFGAKHLQLMATSSTLYWFTHLLFDSATFIIHLLIPTLMIGFNTPNVMFSAYKEEAFFGLVLWGIGLILFAYVISTFTTNLGIASAIFLTLHFIFSFVTFVLVQWSLWPAGVQYLHPSCILKMGFSNLCARGGEGNYYKTALIIHSIVLFTFLVLKDCHILSDAIHRGFSRIFKLDYKEPVEQDIEVKDQEELVKHLRNSEDFFGNSLIVDDLKRWHFDRCVRKPTVKGISFTVKNGECFGLLGVNGAGKTTSFKMMTCDIAASHGHVFVNGYNVFSPTEKSSGLFQIGFCPQHGGFIPTFKGKELLALFARLRGIREPHVSREALKWTEELELTEYADTAIENYSGGNQRKLIAGIALIGSPPVIFLDEPTSGVDPVTRRCLWRVINNLRAKGKSILFTSHSMDECETICTRLAIMVKGSFRCLGEITTLKENFGKGYTVQLKIRANASTDEFTAIKEAMSNEFDPGCDLIDEHLTILQYHITNRAIKWDALFLKLISIKENFDKLESFNASAPTLEQIFISFARNK